MKTTLSRIIQLSVILGLLISLQFCKGGTATDTNQTKADGTTTNSDAENTTTLVEYQYIFKPAAGKRYVYDIHSNIRTYLEAHDKEVETDNDLETTLAYEIVKDSGGIQTLKLKYEKLRITIKKTGEDDQMLDADLPDGEQTVIDRILKNVKETAVYITLNTKGEIISLKGSKELTDKIMAGMVNDNPRLKQMVQQLLNKLTGEAFVKDNIKDGFMIFPANSVKPGNTWKRTVTQNADIDFTTNAEYTLQSLKDNIASIKMNGVVNSEQNKTTTVMGQQVTANLSGEQSGTFKTNIISGMLVSGKTKSSIEGTIQVIGKEVPIRIKIIKEVVLRD